MALEFSILLEEHLDAQAKKKQSHDAERHQKNYPKCIHAIHDN